MSLFINFIAAGLSVLFSVEDPYGTKGIDELELKRPLLEYPLAK